MCFVAERDFVCATCRILCDTESTAICACTFSFSPTDTPRYRDDRVALEIKMIIIWKIESLEDVLNQNLTSSKYSAFTKKLGNHHTQSYPLSFHYNFFSQPHLIHYES